MADVSDVYDERAEWIMDRAAEEGARITPRQFAEWHRQGLIPRPRINSLGHGRGSESLYRRGALRQVVACAKLMARFGDVERVGWELWLAGFPVADRFWREPLRRAHADFLGFSLIAAEPEQLGEEDRPILSDAIEEAINEIAGRTDVPPRLGLASRRLGREGLKQVLAIALSVAIGGFQIAENSEEEAEHQYRLMGRMLGVLAAHHKAVVPASPLVEVTGKAVTENLQTMARELPRIVDQFAPDAVSAQELREWLNEIGFLSWAYLRVREIETQSSPGSTPDIELIERFLSHLSPSQQAMAAMFWAAARRTPGWHKNLVELRQHAQETLRLVPEYPPRDATDFDRK